jgi:exopolysaccharide biosynthesis polyprenyl glycosylphosphotransferase
MIFREDIETSPTPSGSGQAVTDEPRRIEPAWLMPLADMATVFLAFVLAYTLRYEVQLVRPVLEANDVPFSVYIPYVMVYMGWLMLNYATSGLYRRIRGRSFFEENTIIANGVTNAVVVLMAISFMTQARAFSRLMLVYLAVTTIASLAFVRVGRLWMYSHLRAKHGLGVQRVLIVGAGEVGQAVMRVMLARRGLGYLPVGYLDDDPSIGEVDLGRLRGLGDIHNLEDVIKAERVDLVVATPPWSARASILDILSVCRRLGIPMRVVPDVFQLNAPRVHVENLDGIPLLSMELEPTLKVANKVFKRVLDLVLVVLAAPVWLLIFGLVALAIKSEDPDATVFYWQRRVGENGKPFNMMKFRSMIPDADKYREQLVREQLQDPRHPKLVNDPRITRVGHFLRRTSLDELPNLINVLLGHMSLVGPRPPTPDEVRLYDEWHMQRLNTVPGVTGLWQVSGRSDVPFDEMVLLDIYYIENWSIWLDLEILMRTIPRVLLRDGAY